MLFLIACDTQDPFHNKEYDYVGFIMDSMHHQIVNAQKGEMGNFRFHQYSLLMHLILYKDIGYISQDFIDQTLDEFGELPMKLWTLIWDKNFHYTNALVFSNLFSSVIMRMVDHTFFRAPNVLKTLLRPSFLDEKTKLDHTWGDIFWFKECTLMRVYACPQPSDILPKYLPPRLPIIEFFWQFLLMNKEMIPPSLHKPTFVCRSFKVGNFVIGKNAYEELSQ